MKNRTAVNYPEAKICLGCHSSLTAAAYNKNRAEKDGLNSLCRVCAANKHLGLKRKFVAGYGGACTCCGETRIEFLTMEHKNKDGAEHRAKRDVAGAWRDAISANFPDAYTVLCYNCNQSETHGRQCPHKTELPYIQKQLYAVGIV